MIQSYQSDSWEGGEFFSEGLGKKGHLEEAFSSLEQSLVYGKTEVATTLIKAYMNILDMLAIDEKEGEYNRYEMLFGKKIQQYGRILVSERKRKNELEPLDFDSSDRNKS